MMADLERLADQQQTKLAAERSAADRAGNLTLATLFAFGIFAFLTAAGTFYLLAGSVIRPLAALQESAKAIAAGNWSVQARVSGPQEVSSLAHDFNAMTADAA